MTKRGTVSTNNIILTFDSTNLPSEIRVGYVKVRVRPFVPAPMRCFRCQRFGHTKDNCRGRPTCSKCASQDHTDETCVSETPRCVNCGEGQTPHSAYDRSCPAYVKEKEIMTIKATRNLSFKEAREVYNQSHPKTSYAQKFLDLVKGDELVSAYIRRAEGTVFAPTNAALQKYKGERSANVLLYHIVNLAMSMEQLTSERSVPTRLKGSQPVFVSVPRPGHVFINNARIVSSDVRATAETQEDQVGVSETRQD
ncbi:Fasciclin-1 [Amphibalanus amphitrite]|uniref:Fasciclin-1 n=1 Tax=Amphibalanus amphitrite TaxID=1232801 RepID=A0A6A4X5Q8_AMPAM|nr:Fasciclin-1 [Amphibalanus amphitrite]